VDGMGDHLLDLKCIATCNTIKLTKVVAYAFEAKTRLRRA
jgi:hypothetical protein